MDFKELFDACRRGDLYKVKHLVENKEVELNVRDKWDSTPLYYACLCGHTNLVRYLLKCGARCEANTFDGERCVYGALTPEIRNILTNEYKVITAKSIQRNSFDEFLRRAFEFGEYFDVLFCVQKEVFKLHRVILAARCEYFAEMFAGKWKSRKVITLKNPRVRAFAFRALMHYLYTGRLETQIDSVEDVIILAKQCKLYDLLDKIELTMKQITDYASTKPRIFHVTTILVENYTQSKDFEILVQQSLPSELNLWIGREELPLLPFLPRPSFSDILLEVEGHIFRCHKVFFCGRSDFFKALVEDHFLEAHKQIDSKPVFTLHDISLDAFHALLMFVYQNKVDLQPRIAFEVLYASDMFLLTGLKPIVANYIAAHLDPTSVVMVFKTARLLDLPRLENQCTEYMAMNLESVISRSEFHELIMEDAKGVRGREETDTIDVIDDIRYHLGHVQTYSGMQEAEEKLNAIDDLLEMLGLDA